MRLEISTSSQWGTDMTEETQEVEVDNEQTEAERVRLTAESVKRENEEAREQEVTEEE